MRRKICVITGTRAEYGLLSILMREIRKDPAFELQLVVTGTHLSPEFGLTYREIEKDGFTISEKVDLELSGDSPSAITRSTGKGLIGFAGVFDRLRPDIVVVLGDRYEIIAAALAALLARIPIAHIHGGELTEGAMDDSIRHAITKMSRLHFVSTDVYRNRVIQMGEQPDHVFRVGAPGLDLIRELKLLDRAALSRELGFDLAPSFFLVTYHPETLDSAEPRIRFQALLNALERFPDRKILFTKANADPFGKQINEMIDQAQKANPARIHATASLGQLKYLSAMSECAAVVGNSSSGIIEAPLLKVPTVNIGDRQKGRISGTSVIHSEVGTDEITAAIRKALDPDFRRAIASEPSLYGNGGASERIFEILREKLKPADLSSLRKKTFYDLALPLS